MSLTWSQNSALPVVPVAVPHQSARAVPFPSQRARGARGDGPALHLHLPASDPPLHGWDGAGRGGGGGGPAPLPDPMSAGTSLSRAAARLHCLRGSSGGTEVRAAQWICTAPGRRKGSERGSSKCCPGAHRPTALGGVLGLLPVWEPPPTQGLLCSSLCACVQPAKVKGW